MTRHNAKTSPPLLPFTGRHRLEALSDGIYAIALTLLVLELKVPVVPHGASEQAVIDALLGVLPKATTWLFSFWVMIVFWQSQLRIHRLTVNIDYSMMWNELLLLALVSLLPFTSAVMGEYGGYRTPYVLYSAHLTLMGLVSLRRTSHLVRHPELHGPDLTAAVARSLRIRVWMLVGCSAAAFVLAFIIPAWNMFAMLPTALMSRVAPLTADDARASEKHA